MRFIDVFAGVGGYRLGMERAGHECVWSCEIDKFAKAVYEYQFEEAPTGDIRLVNPEEIPDYDILCGGFPCQDFSIAGKRAGLEGTRGTLFYEICRIARVKRPQMLFLENVKGLLSADDHRAFGVILESLGELGYDVEWQVLNSKNYGVPQNRERVFIIGHLGGFGGRQIFPIGESDKSVDGESEPPGAISVSFQPRCSKTGKGGTGTLMRDNEAHTPDGGSQGVIVHPMIARWQNKRDGVVLDDKAPNLRAGGSGIRKVPAVVSPAPLKFLGRNQKNYNSDNAFTVDSCNTGGVRLGTRVRRLTPIECERLQGFPDDWTKWGTVGGKRIEISDAQRYKMMGNAVTVNVIEAVARRF